MKGAMDSSDLDSRGSLPALRRAARSARKLARKTNTPPYVWLNGRVVKLDPADDGPDLSRSGP
jgi:hypothetical protein